jgi:hypothetical protein
MKIEIKILRMDNAGENKLLQQRCERKDWEFAMKYEYYYLAFILIALTHELTILT